MRSGKQTITDFQEVFSGEVGLRVLDKISKACREDQSSFLKGDPHGTSYNEGLKAVIKHIRSVLAKDSNEERPEYSK